MKLSCPNCGSNVTYTPKTKSVHCEHCNTNTIIEELEKNNKESNISNVYEHICSSCGAHFLLIINIINLL